MLVMCDGGTSSKLISDFNYVGVVLIVTNNEKNKDTLMCCPFMTSQIILQMFE